MVDNLHSIEHLFFIFFFYTSRMTSIFPQYILMEGRESEAMI